MRRNLNRSNVAEIKGIHYDENQFLRRVTFRPYRPGDGPTFTLSLWDTAQTAFGGKSRLAYRLTQREPGAATVRVLFAGDDFGCSPMHSIDGDETVKEIMAFLCLRPGDTDDEYFRDYTQRQLDYCGAHAESLSAEVSARFGDD